jgi:hypothetical protein
MRKVMLLVAATLPMLCGCAGTVIFGRTVGQGDSTSAVQAPPAIHSAPAVQPTPAVQSTPTVQSAPQEPSARTAKAATEPRFKAVTVAFSPEANGQTNADPRFSSDALLAAIHADLQTHQLLDEDADAHSHGNVEIVITDFAIQPASNVILFGYVVSNATLAGNIELRDATGQKLRTLGIRADSRLTTRADGGQAQPLGALYRRFADLTVSELTGVPIKAPDTDMPR